MIRSFKYHIAPAHSIENDIQDDCQYIIISTGSRYDMLNEKKNVLVLHFADTELDVRLDSIHLNNVSTSHCVALKILKIVFTLSFKNVRLLW